MKHIQTVLCTAALAAAFFTSRAHAQTAPIPAEIEGPISAAVANGTGATLTVMGQTINVPAGTPIASPTATLTVAQLLDATPLPGRTQPGFIGGTAIVTGTVNAAGVVTAEDVFVEPAENVVVGLITANTATSLAVNGMPVQFITDARMPAQPPQNAFGVPILLNTVPVGTAASIEGYYDGAIFRAFLIEVDGAGDPANPTPQITITRAQTRERTPNNRRGDEVEVRGSVTTFHVAAGVTTQTVRIFRVDNGVATAIGTATATLDPLTPGFAEYRFRATTAPSADPVLGTAPTRLRAVNISAGANNATAEADATVIQ